MFKQLSELSLSGRAEKNRGSFEFVVIHILQDITAKYALLIYSLMLYC